MLTYLTDPEHLKLFVSKDVSYMAKFDGSNFPFWKFQIWIIFEQHDLVGIVNGSEKLPVQLKEKEDSVKSAKNVADIKLWKKKDNSASLFIIATIEQQCQRT